MEVVKGRGYVYSIQYHIVWCVKVSSQYLEWTGRNKIERAADSDFKG